MIYTRKQVDDHTLMYFEGDTLARDVFHKYVLRDGEEFYELTPDNMHARIAKEFGRIVKERGYDEDWVDSFEQDVLERILEFKHIVPQGSPMAGIGNNVDDISLSNCFVVAPPDDSMSGILETGKELANIMKNRGGVGVDISTLRPEGAPVANAAKTTSGAWSFADFYSYVTRMVGQNGRRGALMITMDCRHPDILKFIRMKLDGTKVTGANVSVKWHDDFLEAVENDEEYVLRWPVEASPSDAKIVQRVQAREVFEAASKAATESAEPGCLFWNSLTDYLPADCYPEKKTSSTNPCSEIGLDPYDSCRLISLCLKHYVVNKFEDKACFDWERFKSDVRIAMRMVDALVDLELEKVKRLMKNSDTEEERRLWAKIYNKGYEGRRTGLGTHGLADMLACLKIKYDSEEGVNFIEKVYETMKLVAYDESIELAKTRGPFKLWDWEKEKDCKFFDSFPDELIEKMKKHGRRNVAILTSAPTGSVSIMSQTSSGCEPVFRNFYTRRRKLNHDQQDVPADFVDDLGDRWQEYTVYHHNVKEYMEKTRCSKDELPDFFVESQDIDWLKRIEVQAAMQRHIDHSISSTINLPKGTEPEKVRKIYWEAWKNNLKGVTVYVDGSRSGVLVTDDDKEDSTDFDSLLKALVGCGGVDEQAGVEGDIIVDGVSLPDCFINGDTRIVRREGNKYYMHLSYLPNDPSKQFPIALWIHVNSFGEKEYVSLQRARKAVADLMKRLGVSERLVDEHLDKTLSSSDNHATRLGKVISMALRHGVKIVDIVEAMEGIEGDYIASTLTAVRKFLKEQIEDGTQTGDSCPSCGSENYVYQEGCVLCLDCGHTKCG